MPSISSLTTFSFPTATCRLNICPSTVISSSLMTWNLSPSLMPNSLPQLIEPFALFFRLIFFLAFLSESGSMKRTILPSTGNTRLILPLISASALSKASYAMFADLSFFLSDTPVISLDATICPCHINDTNEQIHFARTLLVFL